MRVLILMCACCVLWCCIICPKCGKILGAGLAAAVSCPAPFIPEIRRQIENIGSTLSREYPANTARHIKHPTPQCSDCIKTYIYSRYFLFFLAAANCRSRCTISLAFLQSKYTAARGKCPKKEAWKLFSEMLLLWWQLVRKKEVTAGDFPKQCYVCMFV